MAKVRLYDEEKGTYFFKCPAGHIHYINTKVPNHMNAQWNFNGNIDKPTFTPSIDEKSGYHVAECSEEDRKYYQEENLGYKCHFVITDGYIQFCGDCSHDLKNTTIELPEIENEK